MKVTPPVAQNNANRRSAIEGRMTQHVGYAISQRKRKRIEESRAWMKTIGVLKKGKLRGPEKGSWLVTFVAAVHNLYAYNCCRVKQLEKDWKRYRGNRKVTFKRIEVTSQICSPPPLQFVSEKH